IRVEKAKGVPSVEREWKFAANTTGKPGSPDARTVLTLAAVTEPTDEQKAQLVDEKILRHVWKQRDLGGSTRSQLEKPIEAGGAGGNAAEIRESVRRLLALDQEYLDAGFIPKLKVEKGKLFCLHPPDEAALQKVMRRSR